MAKTGPQVELLWWEGCPNWERALEDLSVAMREVGLDPDGIEVREVATDADANRESFVGSPTIRIEGQDVQAPGSEEPLGLTCRIYRRRDGRISPLPDPDDVRDALRGATRTAA
jgi:hypothetical protein